MVVFAHFVEINFMIASKTKLFFFKNMLIITQKINA